MVNDTISIIEAEKSVDEWLPFVRQALINAMVDPKGHRDVGKILALSSEYVVNDFLMKKTGRPSMIVVGESHDIITTDDSTPIRTQVKFRKGDWHFETTRRNSAKNQGTNSTGHVAYRKNEFDMVAILIPGETFGISGSKIRLVPVHELINPQKQDQLVPRIRAATKRKCDTDENTTHVIESFYKTRHDPLG